MGNSSNDWNLLERRFRETAAEWLQLELDLYEDSQSTQIKPLVEAKGNSHLFRRLWEQRFNVDSIDWVEDFRSESPLFRTRQALLKDALALCKAELALFKNLKEFRIKDSEDERWFMDTAYSRCHRRSTLVIDHAAYAVYKAWQPESLIVVPDSRPELLRSLSIDPEMVSVISPRQFEELVAFIYESLGCRVQLTQQSRDYGADVLAWHPGPFETETLIAIQVKRYAQNRRVGIKDIFELHGAITHYHANTGQVVTTSDFTGPARRFAVANGYQLVNYRKLTKEILSLFGHGQRSL